MEEVEILVWEEVATDKLDRTFCSIVGCYIQNILHAKEL